MRLSEDLLLTVQNSHIKGMVAKLLDAKVYVISRSLNQGKIHNRRISNRVKEFELYFAHPTRELKLERQEEKFTANAFW